MKIVLLEPIGIPATALKKLQNDFHENGHEFVSYKDRQADEKILIDRAKDADVLILSNIPLPGKVIKACPELKMISVAFAGVDHIDMATCNAQNIIVSNGGDYSSHAVAELTIGMAISLSRKFRKMEAALRDNATRNSFLGNELFGKTFGIVGTGSIGSEVAKLAHAFGCKILAYNRSKHPAKYIKYTDLEDLLQNSDIVSLHIPLSKETEQMIGRKEIALMKEKAILINTARGPIVDYKALSDALQKNEIAGAAIDVYEKEPPIEQDHPLLQHENCLLMPHIGYATEEAIARRWEIVIDNVFQWMDGKPQNLMNAF